MNQAAIRIAPGTLFKNNRVKISWSQASQVKQTWNENRKAVALAAGAVRLKEFTVQATHSVVRLVN